MLEEIAARFPYWMTGVLIAVGLYGMLGKRSLVKKVIGLSILQSAIILFFIAGSIREGGTIPIAGGHGVTGEVFMNPLPHVLMLTAIVVGVATIGVALAFLVRIHWAFGSDDEQVLLEHVRE